MVASPAQNSTSLEPQMRRESRSRPRSSVPSQYIVPSGIWVSHGDSMAFWSWASGGLIGRNGRGQRHDDPEEHQEGADHADGGLAQQRHRAGKSPDGADALRVGGLLLCDEFGHGLASTEPDARIEQV
jgi:hypothetical protein